MILIGYNTDMLHYGIKQPVYWDFTKQNSLLVFGSTGSGKTVAAKSIIARAVKQFPDLKVTIADFKNYDWDFVSDCKRFYPFSRVGEGIDDFATTLSARQDKTDTTTCHHLLVVDELAGYLNYEEKKQSEECRKKLGNILALGRAYSCHTLLVTQRPDSEYFAKNREQLTAVLALQNLSKEASLMFNFDREVLKPVGRGGGYFLVDNALQTPVQIPTFTNFEKMHNLIRLGISR